MIQSQGVRQVHGEEQIDKSLDFKPLDFKPALTISKSTDQTLKPIVRIYYTRYSSKTDQKAGGI
jgi:hypothetical protein